MSKSWYSLNIVLQSNAEFVFNGYFEVDNNTNLVISLYENYNLNNNLLVPTGTGIVPPTPPAPVSYLGFTCYEILNIINIGQEHNIIYDNAYITDWKQFDAYGLAVNIPYLNTYIVNICASTIGGESINNQGVIVTKSEIINVLFNIKSII